MLYIVVQKKKKEGATNLRLLILSILFGFSWILINLNLNQSRRIITQNMPNLLVNVKVRGTYKNPEGSFSHFTYDNMLHKQIAILL